MKSRIKTYTKKQVEWMCEETMEEIDRCINSNGVVFIIALMRHTGWGKKRIEDFIKTLNATMDEFHQHHIDEVFDYMAANELSSIGIDLQQLLPKPLPFKKQLRKSTLEKKQDVNISEAKKIHEKMVEIREYFENQKENDK